MQIPTPTKTWALLLSAGVAIIGTAIGYRWWVGDQPGPPRSLCISNLKQLTTSAFIYAADFDNRLPPRSWDKELYTYHRNRSILDCSEALIANKHNGYAMHTLVMGRAYDQIPDQKEVMFFEINVFAPDIVANLAARSRRRHSHGSLVSRVDGNVKFIPGDREP